VTTRQRIESEIEPTDVFETIVATLVAESGKPVTTRLAARVQAALEKAHVSHGSDYEVRVTRFAGMTNLEWGGYSRSHGNRGGSILLSHNTKSEPIAQKYLDDMAAHLAAKHKRNAARARVLDSEIPERMDAALASVLAAAKTLRDVHDAEDFYSILSSPRRMIDEMLDEKNI